MPDDSIEDHHEYPRFEDSGLEQCPICGLTLGGEAGHLGAVYDADGVRYESLYDTEPSDGPYYCPDCWQEYKTEFRKNTNHQLTEFT